MGDGCLLIERGGTYWVGDGCLLIERGGGHTGWGMVVF